MQMIVGGKKRDASNGEVIEVWNVATKELIDTVPAATVQDAQEALENAVQGAKVWAATPVYKRVEIITRFINNYRARRDELVKFYVAEHGKTIHYAEAEIDSAPRLMEGYLEESKRLFGQTIPLGIQEGLASDLLLTSREPLGVVVGILPFNFPVELFAHKVGAALAAGNAIIVKPPEDDPLTTIIMAEMMHEAGVPGNVLQVVTGYGEVVGDYMTKSPLVNIVNFTGSTDVGAIVAQNAAKNINRVFLELSGNDAVIVCADADIDRVVQETIDGRLINNGQVCCSTKRVLVERPRYEEFKNKLVEKLSTKKLGNPIDRTTDVGPLVNEDAAIAVESQIQQTIEQGAKLLLGGKRFEGTFIEPTVLEVSRDMDVAKDMEIFGPVFSIMPFDTYEEAIEITNNTKFGLTAAIYTNNVYKAIDAGNRIQAGIVSVNGNNCYRPDCIAFGGYKKSGIGREGTNYSLEEFTQVKSIVLRGVIQHA